MKMAVSKTEVEIHFEVSDSADSDGQPHVLPCPISVCPANIPTLLTTAIQDGDHKQEMEITFEWKDMARD